MTWMRFATSETPNGQFVLARLFAGESYENNDFAGTVVLTQQDWERFLDCLVLGASQMDFAGEKLRIYFGPDDGGEG